ncbi:ribokinase [Rhizobium sp. TH2]|uniref:ribokinase n=1 Tax=Rhizobium sp. TH2 TaxID=2775403 RepID=UPI002156FA57|nr:ribokinase [Rhizobium sp. TH2]UVC07316.1 ribokinase [Rhizobium sp. TH2]
MSHDIVILGVFVADTAYRAARQPKMGETLLGNGFALGPGGKGSNQAVAAAKAGGDTAFLSKLGDDAFADMAMKTWDEAGVHPVVSRDKSSYTGAAYIFVEEGTGNNAIIVSPGAAATISPADMDAQADLIGGAKVFVTQLEQPLDAAVRALKIARAGGAATVLNPAPAQKLDQSVFALCDYVTPNETETEILTGLPVTNVEEARVAAARLLELGVKTAIITLGEKGALYHSATESVLVAPFNAGPVKETTGAGDAFNGGFAAALSKGMSPLEAVRFGSAVAGISVTRAGTAPSMPDLAEVEALLARG